MQNFSCKVCFEKFDRLKRKPHVLLNCTHTLCIECIDSLSEKKCPLCNASIMRTNPNWELLDLMEEPHKNKLRNNLSKLANDIDSLKEDIQMNHEKKLRENADKTKALRSQIVARAEEEIKIITDNQKALLLQTKTIESDQKKKQLEIMSNVREDADRLIVIARKAIDEDNMNDESHIEALMKELNAKKKELENKKTELNKPGMEYKFAPLPFGFKPDEKNPLLPTDSLGRIIEMKPEPVLTMMKGNCHQRKKEQVQKSDEYQEQLNIYNKSLKLNSKQDDILLKKADVLLKLGQNDEAIKAIDLAIKIDPNWLNAKAIAFFELNRYEECIEAFDQAYRFNPKDISQTHIKANAYASIGKFQQAIECIDRVLNTKNLSNEYKRTLYLSKREILRSDRTEASYEKASKCLDKILEFFPDDQFVIMLKRCI